ncbi:MAG TPA: NAD(P)(+) transhydrogenase (Re/Si-specific) subunit beta, partial [Solirubrobacterales bacterium]|nr:NAD(P)(+) transhydrogenase (Re/Si-specific) subunit beta [Solirubrobacterales bacterium]
MVEAVLKPGGDAATALYIVAFSLFIIGIKRGTHPTTAKQGNLIAAGGMAIAVVATLLLDGIGNWGLIALGLGIGTAIGVIASIRVQMTEMPQMVALYNGVGGGAVALIAWSEVRHGISEIDAGHIASIPLDALIPVLFAAVVGSVSFWGSNIAFAKLQDLIPTRPLAVPGQQVINVLLLLGIVIACVDIAINNDDPNQAIFIAILLAAGLLGNLVVLPIGGADMPVVISLLNAFTGLSAAAAGFALDNVALIVAGTLVGSSGTILTMEMATAMNRSVGNVLFAGFGGAPAGGAGGSTEERPHTSIGAQDAAIKLAYADSVVIVPGYGLAVAQAQHAIKEVADELEQRGVTVSYAIHPVAGRMPGHMNVLLAEADVPYEQLKEMEEINPEMPRTDVAVVVGANDVTNPAAKNDPDSPIAGMPIIE